MHPRRVIIVRLCLIAALGLAVARLVAPASFDLDGGELTLRVRPALPGGRLALSLGPLGELSWKTHKAPLDIEASFLIDRGAARAPGLGELEDVRLGFLARKLPWLLISGALVGALAVEGARRRRLLAMAIASGATILTGVALVGMSVLTFNPQAFDHPRYRGPIEDAPRVLRLLKEVRRDWPGVERNIAKLAVGLERLHSQILSRDEGSPERTVKLLVISDVHNNPLGLLIARELAERFDVDGALNAGDLTDRGTRPEAELFARFGDLGIPQVVAPGNHEDTATVARLARMPNTTVLAWPRDTATVAGIRVLGESDPNASTVDSDPNNELARREIPVICDRLARRLDLVRPAVLLVHDPKLGECAARAAEEEEMPLVFVWGHLHRPAYEQRGTVTFLSPGTSGANGIKSAKQSPYGFALLEIDPVSGTLVSACLFQFDGPKALRQASCHIASRIDAGGVAGGTAVPPGSGR